MLDNIFVPFGAKLCEQVVGIPMGTNFDPLVADLFLSLYEGNFVMSLSDDKRAGVVDAFNTASGCLGDVLDINSVYFDTMVGQVCPSELQLNRVSASDTEAEF